MNNQPIKSDPNTALRAPVSAAVQPAAAKTALTAVNPTAVNPTAVNPTAVNPAPVTGTSGDGMSIASFVLGLISVIFLPLGTIPGFLGFVLSLDAKKRGSRHSLLGAGRVLSIIGMVAIPALYLLVFLAMSFSVVIFVVLLFLSFLQV